MNSETLLISELPAEGVSRLTLNRPHSRNALSRALRAELVARLTEIARDDAIEVVILTGAGDVFCAGFDLKELSTNDASAVFADAANYHRIVHRFPKPIIAAVNGPALAGGMDLALMCDMRLGTMDARFGQPQVRFGIPAAYDLVASVCGMNTARHLCLTGEVIESDVALARSILSERFADNAQLQQEALNSATAIAQSGSGRASKSAFLAGQPTLFEDMSST